ncbi:MAG TPA: CAP domain-containing protein [Acidimicrobiales bacterium]|nr:CAP domain-containing protein [Acidimicrobiales bacterium]
MANTHSTYFTTHSDGGCPPARRRNPVRHRHGTRALIAESDCDHPPARRRNPVRHRHGTRALIAGVVLALFVSLVGPGANPVSAATATSRVVAIASTARGGGYWTLSSDGRVVAVGDAVHRGDLGGSVGNAMGLTPSPTYRGYWITTSDGRVSAFGDAGFHGDLSGVALSAPVVAMAATPSGAGYWLVASDGGVFSFGDARFHGSTGGMRLNRPVVGMSPTASGAGYWLVASDGGIFAFGDARFHGSTGGMRLDRPVIGMSTSGSGAGYLLVASDGGIFTFGSARFEGSLGGRGLTDISGVAPVPDGSGYFLARSGGQVIGFGRASAVAPAPSREADIASEIFTRVNLERTRRGLPELAWDPELATTAGAWSVQMSRTGFSHSNLTSVSASLATPHSYLGENIYWGWGTWADSDTAHSVLFESAPHREAMLETGYTTVGIGVYCDASGKLWVTEQFGRLDSQGSPAWSGPRSQSPRADVSSVANTSC